jgi:hypothetical protein
MRHHPLTLPVEGEGDRNWHLLCIFAGNRCITFIKGREFEEFLLIAEHLCAFFAADRLFQVVGVDLDGDSLIAGLQALGANAVERVGFRR